MRRTPGFQRGCGESFGYPKAGGDEAPLGRVSSADAVRGFQAGDALTMRATVQRAAQF
uniref:LamB/YcsF family protein n=1 Tax=Tessaracoccus timonensis TaxID=2161816 RepID=UPI000D5513D1